MIEVLEVPLDASALRKIFHRGAVAETFMRGDRAVYEVKEIRSDLVSTTIIAGVTGNTFLKGISTLGGICTCEQCGNRCCRYCCFAACSLRAFVRFNRVTRLLWRLGFEDTLLVVYDLLLLDREGGQLTTDRHLKSNYLEIALDLEETQTSRN